MFVSSGYSLYGRHFEGTNLLKKQLETVARGATVRADALYIDYCKSQ